MTDDPVDILLVEDDHRLAELTADYLRESGFGVAVESRGDQALERFRALRPQLVILDLMLPGADGLSVCRELRRLFDGPILILTAKGADIDQVIGLEAGADDYVAKPVDPIVLLARTRALLRRATRLNELQSTPHADIRIGALRVSDTSKQVWLDGEELDLTTQEYELLLLLARHAGTVLSRQEIFRATRGIEYDGMDRSIDGRISKLRKKLGDSATRPSRIKTIWGRGYLLAMDTW